jgi:hypothetical protein
MEQNDSFAIVITDFAGSRFPQNWSRRGWNGPNQFIALQVPDANSKMTLPYIYISTVQGNRVPWFPSQADLLSVDWYIV